MTKIVLNGAGSVEFTKELLADILGFEDLAGSTIALFDVNSERLETAEAIARWTVGALDVPATIEAHMDRRAALEGADHVISMIRVGGHDSRSPGATACGRRWRTLWASEASSGPFARSRRCSNWRAI